VSKHPPRALALETTTRRAEVALLEAGRLVAAGAFEAGLKHTAELLPLIDRLCRSQGWTPASIDEIYVSAGPGGFTGTRIGVTFAKTFAATAGKRLVAVPTPRVVVENAPPEASDALVVVDARRGSVWVQPFARRGGQWKESSTAMLSNLAEVLESAPRPVWLLGEGVAIQEIGPDPHIHLCPDATPRAAVVGALGYEMSCRGEFTDAMALVPTYVRRPEAEEKRLGLP
jgi:tRNA threonylcarbamoyladenosine biosynthesis protein TsaB